jgi:hypothetical protein
VDAVEVQADLHGSQHIVEIIAIDALGRERAGGLSRQDRPLKSPARRMRKGRSGSSSTGLGFFLFSQVNFAETGTGNARHSSPFLLSEAPSMEPRPLGNGKGRRPNGRLREFSPVGCAGFSKSRFPAASTQNGNKSCLTQTKVIS